MIQSQRWLRLRHDKLTHNPFCECCYSSEVIEPATEVHHIIPCEGAITDTEMERLMFDYTNLQSLCHPCHARAHKDLHSKSRKFIQERNASRLKRFESRYILSAKQIGGESFLIDTPIYSNPLPQSSSIFGGNETDWEKEMQK